MVLSEGRAVIREVDGGEFSSFIHSPSGQEKALDRSLCPIQQGREMNGEAAPPQPLAQQSLISTVPTVASLTYTTSRPLALSGMSIATPQYLSGSQSAQIYSIMRIYVVLLTLIQDHRLSEVVFIDSKAVEIICKYMHIVEGFPEVTVELHHRAMSLHCSVLLSST